MKQRNKEELLRVLKKHDYLKRDIEIRQDSMFASNCTFWRTSVSWMYLLWQKEKLRSDVMQRLLQQITTDMQTMNEQKRKNIRSKLAESNWILENRTSKKKIKNQIEQYVNEYDSYNADIIVDFSLLVCEWLLDKRKKEISLIDEYLEIMNIMDNFSTMRIRELRQLLYLHKNIWIELTKEDTEKFINCSDDVEMIVI